MPRKVLIHITVLLTAVVIIFFWTISDSLSYYSLQLTAILLITLIVAHHLLKPATFKLAESTISTMAVLLIIQSTGGLTSPLFFLNFFLLFELSFLLEAIIPIILSIGLMIFYFLTSQPEQSVPLYGMFLAFPLMTPLAFIVGKLYQKEENQKKEIKNLSKKIGILEEELVEEELDRRNQ